MSKINRVPRGIQDLLGNTAQGQNPAELLQSVRPTFDLLPWWSTERIDFTNFIGSFAAVFQQQTIRVPQGELWIPISMSGDSTTTVIGEEIVFVLGISDNSNTLRVHLAQSVPGVSTTALETYAAAFTWSQIQPLQSGTYVYMQCHKFNAAGARTSKLALKFIRLKI